MTPEILRMIRKIEDLSIQQMASRVGLSASLIKKMERGERLISKRSEKKVRLVFKDEKIQRLKELAEYGCKQNERTKVVE